MKEIGDKLRRCPNGVCVLDGKIDRAVQKVIDEKNFVAVLVILVYNSSYKMFNEC